MSAGQLSRHATRSTRSKSSRGSEGAHAAQAISAPDNVERAFDPCAATASFFVHAQHNTIFCLHHDTLAVERKFEKHKEDVLLIASDNISERGAGRLMFSYDAGLTAIVWDLFTGDELARFSSYDHIRVATWMRDGRVAFGDSQGTVTLFDPATHEHAWERTIFDPVTALAPAVDCNTFAIGYLNGSILIATLRPFTILHTLNTARGPSPITGLAWHGSSSKQKTEMLATQTSDGDLRVWSVSKPPATDAPRIIRILGGSEMSDSTRSWFGWSKNGRIVQYNDGETRSWDVRTKKVSHVNIPTIPDVAAITNYGPTATLFTIGQHHMIQQYDLNPQSQPTMVANVSHAPVNAPPTPPDSIPRETPPPVEPPTVPMHFETGSSEEEGQQVMSPLQKIAQEMDQMEEERRDRVTPLSPVSSRASSRNSLSSASSYGRRTKSRPRDKGYSSKQSDHDSESTLFSSQSSMNTGHESMSIRSTSSGFSSAKYQPSSLRHQTLRSPEDVKSAHSTDLFPFVKARLTEVKFRTPHYNTSRYTPDVLRKEMLSIVFGWDHDIESLIRDEQSRHKRGSASCVLLAKWLGDNGADTLAQIGGTESMTSSDWMLLALSCQIGQGSQKQVGEAFVRRMLETDEVHPAVAILLGLGQQNDAVEAYVSRKYFMEAVLLTCLLFPNDWQRQSYLVRKWAETAVANNQPELAVRCFSCTSIESSEPWFSPRAQDEVYAAQQDQFTSMSPTSPPSAGNSERKTTKNASLKLITNFEKEASRTQSNTAVGVTPILDSALSPGGALPYKRSGSRGLRDPSSARTATPSGYGRKRAGSSDVSSRTNLDPERTPHANGSRGPTRPGSRTSNADPGTAINSRKPAAETLPSPAHGVFTTVRERSRPREVSRERNPYGLQIQMANVKESEETSSPFQTSNSTHSHNRPSKSQASIVSSSREDLSPLLTDGTSKSYKGRSIDRYINSLEEANFHAEQTRAQNRSRGESRDGRSRSRPGRHDSSESREDVTFIRPSKRSPSSPVPMTTDDASRYLKHSKDDCANASDVASPVESRSERPRARSRSTTSRARGSSRTATRAESPEGRRDGRSDSRSAAARASSKGRVRATSPQGAHGRDDRGRSHGRKSSGARSPSSPSPMGAYKPNRDHEMNGSLQDLPRRQVPEGGRRTASPERRARARSGSRRSREPGSATSERPPYQELPGSESKARNPALQLLTRTRELSRKEMAAKELEERRLSLARRPSAPAIIHPGQLSGGRPQISPRSATETGPSVSAAAFFGDLDRERSRTVDPENIRHSMKLSTSGSPSTGMPSIGLPATPRAMRHPRYMGSEPDANDAIPAVPALPANMGAMGPPDAGSGGQFGGMLSSAVYTQAGNFRSASAPPEQTAPPSRSRQNSRGHARRPSERDILAGGVPEDHQVVIIEEPDEHQPPVLPELQHLATPPPPPPPPVPSGPVNVGSYFPSGASVSTNGSGVINIAIDNGTNGSTSANPNSNSRANSRTTTPAAEHAPGSSASNAAPPLNTRRGRGSISGPSASTEKVSETFSSKWGKVKDRMRSDSRNRTKSPQQQQQVENFAPSPYETVLPNKQRSVSSPQAGKGEQQQQMPPPPPPVPERGSPPRGMNGGYRNPREVKEHLQPGTYGSSGVDGGMI